MSTKWNNAQKLQKTPKVCKKQPPDFPPEFDLFNRYPLQCYVYWSQPFTPVDGSLAGWTTLQAYPESNLHFGSVAATDISIEVDLLYNDVTKVFTLTVQILHYPDILESRSVQFSEPPAKLPFEFGLYTWEPGETTATVRIKILS